jgi:hypothetical protein
MRYHDRYKWTVSSVAVRQILEETDRAFDEAFERYKTERRGPIPPNEGSRTPPE